MLPATIEGEDALRLRHYPRDPMNLNPMPLHGFTPSRNDVCLPPCV
jgi:hypothetical protein